jgi:hypothetical protein
MDQSKNVLGKGMDGYYQVWPSNFNTHCCIHELTQGYIVNQNWQYWATKIDNTQPILYVENMKIIQKNHKNHIILHQMQLANHIIRELK